MYPNKESDSLCPVAVIAVSNTSNFEKHSVKSPLQRSRSQLLPNSS